MVDSKQQWKAWLYLSPALVLLLIFTVWPIFNTLRMAFLNGYSVAAAHKSVGAGDVVTLFGDFSKQGDFLVLSEDGRFVTEDATDDRTDEQRDIVNELYDLDNGESLGQNVALLCEITDVKSDYNVRTKLATFYAEAKQGTKTIQIVCQKVKMLDFEFSSATTTMYLIGKIAKTGDSVTPYVMDNGNYKTEFDFSKSKKNKLANSQDETIAKFSNLEVGQSTDEVTVRVSVYSLTHMNLDGKVDIVCQAIDSSSNLFYINCTGLNASELSGATMDGFHFGFENFQKVVDYAQFGQCLKNTMLLTVLTVPLSTLLALLISVCLNAIKPLQKLLQTIFFLPYVTNSIAIGMVFAAMFNIVGTNVGTEKEIVATIGVINNVIEFFGGTKINWMNAGSSYAANVAVMVIYIVWNALPFKILILLGGLQSVNKQYYDAAKIDGTSKWRTFWRITVPLLSPMIAYVIITGFIGGFKEYSSIVGVFGETMGPAGDPVPGGTLNTMVGYIYNSISNSQGVASAASLILFGIIMVVTIINLKVSDKKVHY